MFLFCSVCSSLPHAMIFYFYQLIIFILLSLFSVLSVANNTSSSNCTQSCGKLRVSYPFGFSEGCKIKLDCSGNPEIGKIGVFPVRNVTSDKILISIPAECNRPAAQLSKLFSNNYAVASNNGLLLTGCKSSASDCVIPERLAAFEFNQKNCSSGARNSDHYNMSCYSAGHDDEKDFLNYTKVITERGCSYLYSSIMADSNQSAGSGSGSSSVWLRFEMIELGWWVDGRCGTGTGTGCHGNATCTTVQHGGRQGIRCNCKAGYVGDGFANGTGCKKVPICSAPKYMPVQCGETKVGILVGEVAAAASMMVTVLAAVCVCVKRRRKSLRSTSFAMHLLSEAAGNSNVPLYPYKEIERATNSFAEKQRLGTGAYGTVYAGKLNNDEWVAIKKLRRQDHDSVEQVMNEIKLLSSVSHDNLVRLLGCCIDNGEQILVYEYMPNGTLSQHLQRERSTVLPWTIRLTIAAETAHAIAHLHSAMNPPIYHRDIKSSNILLDFSFKSKVADFGLSRLGMMDDSHVSTAPQGTPGYVDPQYHQNFHLSDKSDVYSFGVVLVEIITAKKAVDFSRPHGEINLAALAIDRIRKGCVDEIIDPFLEPNRDAWTLSSVHKVAELAFRCLAFHREMRPSMMEVADELEQIRLSGWAPMEDNICMGSSVASSCSSPYLGSEKSVHIFTAKKSGPRDIRVIFPRRVGDVLPTAEKAMDSSPVSVQDPWLSEESPPSTNSLSGSQGIAENGLLMRANEMKDRRLRVFISPKKCLKILLCASGKCWCCGLKLATRTCWYTFQACLRHCAAAAPPPRRPPK